MTDDTPEKAGDETDREVAEKVMGWCYAPGTTVHMYPIEGFRPSESMDHAWLVVREMLEDFHFSMSYEDAWDVSFYRKGSRKPHDGGFGYDKSAPLAICRAALQAVKPQ